LKSQCQTYCASCSSAHKYPDDGYGWPVTLIYAELLERLPALNHEGAAAGWSPLIENMD
jgi:hypothetical protein